MFPYYCQWWSKRFLKYHYELTDLNIFNVFQATLVIILIVSILMSGNLFKLAFTTFWKDSSRCLRASFFPNIRYSRHILYIPTSRPRRIHFSSENTHTHKHTHTAISTSFHFYYNFMPLLIGVFKITFTAYMLIEYDKNNNVLQCFHINNISSLILLRLINNAISYIEVNVWDCNLRTGKDVTLLLLPFT